MRKTIEEFGILQVDVNYTSCIWGTKGWRKPSGQINIDTEKWRRGLKVFVQYDVIKTVTRFKRRVLFSVFSFTVERGHVDARPRICLYGLFLHALQENYPFTPHSKTKNFRGNWQHTLDVNEQDSKKYLPLVVTRNLLSSWLSTVIGEEINKMVVWQRVDVCQILPDFFFVLQTFFLLICCKVD